MKFSVIKCGQPANILVEDSALEGVKYIAKVVAYDLASVAKQPPEMVNSICDMKGTDIILFATVGYSSMLDILQERGLIDTGVLKGKNESYIIVQLDTMKVIDAMGIADRMNIDCASQILLVIGSDKRGTIYGMFHISEACGVTSLEYLGDSKAPEKDDVMLTAPFLSKEPSIKYRGFFINDEWPAFGNWCNEQFGGFNSGCYEKLFIFLLRMKGNFLWPAMWSAVFSEDGPGIDNAKLADTLGVVMGTSHHEPLCRAGEEWQHIYKQYGDSNAWNFISNKEAISKFWEDGMLRNRKFENLVTIGMRGEADSKLLGEDATMADNIQVVKDAIIAQHEILRKTVNEDLTQIPRVLAIYKEVEDYYYGDETCEGLKDWDELRDVIFLLSDDNWANTRGLPMANERNHPGGYGMYYHFDYHGGPISYEWQATSRLTKTWEQMTQAYEYGVREEWIVNVGDLKGNEYPLTYFMALAYDYERYSKPGMTSVFANEWVDKHFHGELDDNQKEMLLKVMHGASSWNALRKPEALHAGVYHPVNYNETRRVISEVEDLLKTADELRNSMNERCKETFESVLYYQYVGSLNILLMQLYAGLNDFYARNRSLLANEYADKTKECISRVEDIIDEYNHSFNGKWNHMLDSGFTGFRNWDDYDWGYPTVSYVTPINKPKMMIGFENGDRFHLGAHWQDGNRICNNDMLRPDTDNVNIILSTRGKIGFEWTAISSSDRILFEPANGKISANEMPAVTINVKCNKEISSYEKIDIDVAIKFADGTETVGKLAVMAAGADYYDKYAKVCEKPKCTYVEQDGVIAIKAEHFAGNNGYLKENDEMTGWKAIEFLGRKNGAVKCFPVTEDFTDTIDPPKVTYDFIASHAGVYTLEVDVLARNPVVMGQDMVLFASANGESRVTLKLAEDDFYAGHTCPQWCMGVLDNVRRIRTDIKVKEGFNKLYIIAGSPNVSFDKIIIFDKEKGLKDSYLGPVESCTVSD